MPYPENFNSNAVDAFWGTDSDAWTRSDVKEWAHKTAGDLCAAAKASFDAKFRGETWDRSEFDFEIIAEMLMEAARDVSRQSEGV